AAEAAGGPGDPARAGVRGTDDRGRRPHAARPRAKEAGGDLRRVRSGGHEIARGRRGRARRDVDPGDPRAAADRARLPQGGRGGDGPAPGGAVLDGAAPTALVRAHLGPDTGRRALVPTRPDAQRPATGRAVRAARRVPTQRATGRPLRPGLVLTRGRALATRAGTRGEEAQGRLGN